jgi:CHC2 zinc finger
MTLDREVRDAVDPARFYAQYVRLKKIPGYAALGLCPFHKEKTPSFRVNLRGHRYPGRYYCHGCQEHGDAIDFLARIESVSRFEALKELAADAGIAIGPAPLRTREDRAERERERAAALAWLRERWKFWRRELDELMRDGPPEFESQAYRDAEHAGEMLRLAERLANTTEFIEVFRRAGSPGIKIAGKERFNSLVDRLQSALIARLLVERGRRTTVELDNILGKTAGSGDRLRLERLLCGKSCA